ncbi:PHP domain-containing protein [Saxibacter everestensis]|uniref:PHP domain-containing protein n=1 Tax=Saxibacter everestensis TaxID=2909229 RepID=A0ABY8QQK9_9MICO|nr:PHP domain-containing protein [Brevibacteriaceae bacterium ZFBP1038]
MSQRIDLHTHSAVSDGTEAPADLIRSAAAAGVRTVALTDHDTVTGWEEASIAARAEGVSLVPGMEISCRHEGISVHLLSYLHDPLNIPLMAEVLQARESRVTRAQLMVDRLAVDYDITWEKVVAHTAAGATIGRPHLADALVTLGVVDDRSAAFEHILTPRSPYYVSLTVVSPIDAIRLVRAAGGVPVFAHPMATARGRVVSEQAIELMIDAGLGGFEVDHRDNPPEARRRLREIAASFDLLVTGSSDYHGTGKPNRLGENLTDPEMLSRLEAQATGCSVVRG